MSVNNRYFLSFSNEGRPMLDSQKAKHLSVEDLHSYLNEYDNLINEIVDYLDTNELTSIGHNSILHNKCRFLTGK